MNSGTFTYQLPTFNGLLAHALRGVSFVRDTDQSLPVNLELDAQVRSGDYFVDLATRLDELSRNIEDYQARDRIETIVSDLIYLQDSYAITKNSKE